jgi:hypothetical protein
VAHEFSRLATKADDAVRASECKSTFLAVMSHEVCGKLAPKIGHE